MAGSYRHIVNSRNEFRGVELIDDLGDAYEALEECYDIIRHLSGDDKAKIHEAWREGHLRRACPSNADDPISSYERYWERDEDDESLAATG